MAGTLKVDNLNADSNLALKIANTAVAFIDSTGLKMSGSNLQFSGGGTLTVAANNAIVNPTITTPTISGNTTFDSGTLFVDATNDKVGVGTSNPAAKFHVNGDMQADNFYCTTNGVTSLGSLSSSSSFTIRGSTAGVPDIAQIYTNNVERVRVTATGLLQFDSGYGSAATAYGCRAWVNFNGTGTVAIRASGNVSSITDNADGNYYVNFTNAMPDANFAAIGAAMISGNYTAVKTGQDQTTTRTNIETSTFSTWTDAQVVAVAIFR